MKGVMMLFSGAVAGLRNPRAHGFIEEALRQRRGHREIARTYNVSHSTISRLEP